MNQVPRSYFNLFCYIGRKPPWYLNLTAPTPTLNSESGLHRGSRRGGYIPSQRLAPFLSLKDGAPVDFSKSAVGWTVLFRRSTESRKYVGHGAFPENDRTAGVSPGRYEISCAPASGCCRSCQDSLLPEAPSPPVLSFYPTAEASKERGY